MFLLTSISYGETSVARYETEFDIERVRALVRECWEPTIYQIDEWDAGPYSEFLAVISYKASSGLDGECGFFRVQRVEPSTWYDV
jgi:hypothetical protein